jgi:GGDEF domain-containing protein
MTTLSMEALMSLSKEELARMVMDLHKDTLTGCYKREVLDTVKQDLYTVAFVDVNGLKAINDTQGHEYGDKHILSVVDSINANVRKQDTVVRYGGDEFIIIFNDCSIDNAKGAISRITSASVGIAQHTDLDMAIKLADMDMYKNKRNYYDVV